MTQLIVNVSDHSILPGLKKVLSRIGGVEKVEVVKEHPQTRRQKFLSEFREAVKQTKDFKEGKAEFGTWEDMMNEL